MTRNQFSQNPIALLSIAAVLLLSTGCSDTPEQLFERAQEKIQERDFMSAYIYFQDFMEQFPGDPLSMEVMFGMAFCHVQLGEFADARQMYAKIEEQFGSEDENIQFEIQSRIGGVYIYEGKAEEGRRVFREIADASAPLNYRMSALDTIARSYIQDASFQLARDAMNETIAAAIQFASDVPDECTKAYEFCDNIRFQQAQTWLQQGERLEAVEIFNNIAVNPVSSDIQRALALYKAAETLDYTYRVVKWVDEETGEERTKDDRNAILTGQEHDAVLAAYQRVYETYPENDYAVWARVEAARILRDDGKQEEADALLEEAVKRYNGIVNDPIDEDHIKWAMSKCGDCYLRLERLQDARAAFLRLYRQYPDDPNYARIAQARVAEIDRMLAGETGPATDTVDIAAPPDAASQSAEMKSKDDVGSALSSLSSNLVFLCIGLLGTVFWVWMLTDCAMKEPSEGNDKIVWIVIILLTSLIGALIYFFVRRPKRKSDS